MSPTFVFDENRQIKLIVGAKGGPRIITSTLQTILNVIDGNMSLSDAVHYRRIHHQWMPDQIFYEAGTLAPTTVHSLEAKGHKLTEKRRPLGSVQAIMRVGEHWEGVSDTRSEGKPLGL